MRIKQWPNGMGYDVGRIGHVMVDGRLAHMGAVHVQRNAVGLERVRYREFPRGTPLTFETMVRIAAAEGRITRDDITPARRV